MSKNFEVFAKSFQTDQWRSPVLTTDSLDDAIKEAFYWFDQEGWYSQIIDTNHGEVIFMDYHFIGNWELMY